MTRIGGDAWCIVILVLGVIHGFQFYNLLVRVPSVQIFMWMTFFVGQIFMWMTFFVACWPNLWVSVLILYTTMFCINLTNDTILLLLLCWESILIIYPLGL